MSNENVSEISIIYSLINNNNSINIFGGEFVKNNKNICKLIIDNKEYELTEKYKIENYKDIFINFL